MTEISRKLDIIKKAVDDKKGLDLEVLEVGKLTSIAEYFVIASGNSSNQVLSIADEIDEKMSLEGFETLGTKEGYRSARWIVLDYDDVVVHIFHREEREYYNLERLWAEFARKPKED